MSHSQRLLRFFIIGCLLLLMFEGYHQLKMVQADHGRSHAETRADMKNIVPSLSLAQLRTYLTQSEKPSLLFIYASWCPHCQRMAPYISELAEANPHSLQVIALSVDRNPEQLADYLCRTRPPFTTYTPAYEESERLAAALQQF